MNFMNEIQRLGRRFIELSSNESVSIVAQRAMTKAVNIFSYPFIRSSHERRTFTIQQVPFNHFVHPYNETWKNERAVEIALTKAFLSDISGLKLLELGNVSQYYFPNFKEKTVVDKYERSAGVMNIDILDYAGSNEFEALLSISTFEHIGWDESPKRPEKVGEAISKFLTHAHKSAPCLISYPLGYNSFLDSLAAKQPQIASGGLPNHAILIRCDDDNNWQEAPLEVALKAKYGSRWKGANALYVAWRHFPTLDRIMKSE